MSWRQDPDDHRLARREPGIHDVYDDEEEDLTWQEQWGSLWDNLLDIRDTIIDFIMSPVILLIILAILAMIGAAVFTWLTSGDTGETPRAQEIRLGEPNQIAMDWDVPNPPIFTIIPQYDEAAKSITGQIIIGEKTDSFTIKVYTEGDDVKEKLGPDGYSLGWFQWHTIHEDADNNPETLSTGRDVIVFVREPNPPDNYGQPAEPASESSEGS